MKIFSVHLPKENEVERSLKMIVKLRSLIMLTWNVTFNGENVVTINYLLFIFQNCKN